MNKTKKSTSCIRLRPRPSWARCAPAALVIALLAYITPAWAQLPIGPSTQFDITGFLQEATLTTPTDPHSGGTLKVNGHVIIVPRETVVILPANALTWQEVFAKAPAPWGLAGAYNTAISATANAPTTGMALADCANLTSPCTAAPLTTYEVHVVGNRVLPDANHPTDSYIAGLVNISQQGLNSGQGFINYIDYANAEMRVGGTITIVNGLPTLNAANPGARVRINDPVGRYSSDTGPIGSATPLPLSPDFRFTVDPDNPTIMAATGFPMCLPRVAADPLATAIDDPLCPLLNRPPVAPPNGFATSFQMNDPRPLCTNPPTNTIPAGCSSTGSGPAAFPTALQQAPFEVGDYVTFAGTLVKDAPAGGFAAGDGPTVGPMPAPATPPAVGGGAAATYISAHTIVSNVAIYTWPGTNPAYIMTDVTIIGTGGLTVIGAQEAAIRSRFEGMMTDPSRLIHLYGIDLDPLTGATTDRDWGTIGADPGPPNGAVKGRWRFRPPCLAFGTVPARPDKQCVGNVSGSFLPPTREMRAVVEGLQGQNPANVCPAVSPFPAGCAVTAANGIFYGQYHAPISEYIFPEPFPGAPIVENNFNAIPFLAQGGYSSSGIPSGAPTLVGVLNPWPSNVLPGPPPCVGAIPNAGGPYQVAAGGSIRLIGTATGSGPISFSWITPSAGTLSSSTVAEPVYTAPLTISGASQTVTLTLTTSNGCSSSSTTTTITIFPASVITLVANPTSLTVRTGGSGSFAITGFNPSGLPLTITATQAPVPGSTPPPNSLPVLVVSPTGPTSANVNFVATTLALGQAAISIQLTITATDGSNTSAPIFTTINITPNPDSILITSVEVRTLKQRLIVNATSSVISPLVTLKLQPYQCAVEGPLCPLVNGVPTYDPNPTNGPGLGDTFTNNGGGLYILDSVGAPRPACNGNPADSTLKTYVTPCSLKVITVKSSLGGVGGPSAVTRIRN